MSFNVGAIVVICNKFAFVRHAKAILAMKSLVHRGDVPRVREVSPDSPSLTMATIVWDVGSGQCRSGAKLNNLPFGIGQVPCRDVRPHSCCSGSPCSSRTARGRASAALSYRGLWRHVMSFIESFVERRAVHTLGSGARAPPVPGFLAW